MVEPVTFTAVVAVLTYIAQSAGQAVVGNAAIDAYTRLKMALRQKFGGDSEVVKSVEGLEVKPDSEGRRMTLEEELEASGADGDPELRALAQELLDRLNAQPGGEQHIQNASGSYIAQADRGSTAEVNVDSPRGRAEE